MDITPEEREQIQDMKNDLRNLKQEFGRTQRKYRKHKESLKDKKEYNRVHDMVKSSDEFKRWKASKKQLETVFFS